jgi:hypothetical protein
MNDINELYRMKNVKRLHRIDNAINKLDDYHDDVIKKYRRQLSKIINNACHEYANIAVKRIQEKEKECENKKLKIN